MEMCKREIYVGKVVNIETDLASKEEFEKVYLYQNCVKCSSDLEVLTLDAVCESYYCEKCGIEYYRTNI